MLQTSETGILLSIESQISKKLTTLGLLFRIFSRCKSKSSIQKKIDKVPGKYSAKGKKIQDLFGIRIVLYFQDDIDVAIEALKSIFETVGVSKTKPDSEKFSPMVCNYVFRLEGEYSRISPILLEEKLVDSTFEVQFRTTLSEGWHEVEHDLRYKCKEDWQGHDELDRSLNGIYATLSTADWGMMQLFESLAYKHYKSSHFEALLRTKYRLRLQDKLTEDLIGVINPKIAKKIYRVNRVEFLNKLNKSNINIPMNFNNLVFLLNHFYLQESKITQLMPVIVAKKLTM